MLPADGTYTLEVSAGAGPGGSYAFRLVETSDRFDAGHGLYRRHSGSGQAQTFRVDVPAASNSASSWTTARRQPQRALREVRLPADAQRFPVSRFEAVRRQQMIVPSAAPGTWYVLLYSERPRSRAVHADGDRGRSIPRAA